jgi:hypothetical protein
MTNQNPNTPVRVSFTAPDTWSFDPDDCTVRAQGNVVLLREPANSDWQFVDADIDDPYDQFTTSPSPAQVTIRDDFKHRGSFKYTVTVRLGDETYTSPDPRIINDGP